MMNVPPHELQTVHQYAEIYVKTRKINILNMYIFNVFASIYESFQLAFIITLLASYANILQNSQQILTTTFYTYTT